ncbi:hypothetical protein BS78_K256500 [Paspalum vaginatum]|uniref:Uncharacterized protein n=1 Tax=Paspalum vaginatum TaxID=158149 RepID=A0A9W8CG74_9POAL|nr:hypothetical protein BS78_K256500 [Paspalum vaginatum]
MLGNRGQALVQQVLQAVMVRLDAKAATPKVRPPVAHRLDQADELALVRRKCSVSRCHGPAEEGDRMALLDEDCAEPVRRSVALDDEGLAEVRHGQHGRRGDRVLERGEGRGSPLGPSKALLLEKNRERRRDGAVVGDELAVVAREAEEAVHHARRARYRPVVNGLHLGGIHGHARLRDRVAEVGDGGDSKHTLGALDEEGVLLKRAEDGAEMSKVIRPRLAVDQDVVKEDKYKATKKRAQYIVHECLKRGRGVA